MSLHRRLASRNVFRRFGAFRHLAAFVSDRRGATAIEYGLIAALVVLAIIGSVAATGDSVGDGWNTMANRVIAALQGG